MVPSSILFMTCVLALAFQGASLESILVGTAQGDAAAHTDDGADQNNTSALMDAVQENEWKEELRKRGIVVPHQTSKHRLSKEQLAELLQLNPAGVEVEDVRQPKPDTSHTSEGEERLIEMFQRVSPAVGTVQADMFETKDVFPGITVWVEGNSASEGTCFLIDKEGHVITNYHVVYDRTAGVISNNIAVRLGRTDEYKRAELVGAFNESDIAVLKLVDTENLPAPLQLGNSSDLVVGQTVVTIGRRNCLTKGIISAIDLQVSTNKGMNVKSGIIQTDGK